MTSAEEFMESQDEVPTARDAFLRESDLRDEIQSIDRKRVRILVAWTSLSIIAGVALFQAPAQFAALPLLPFLTVKKAVIRYRALASRRSELLHSLDALKGLEG